jgi:hypothetical protein
LYTAPLAKRFFCQTCGSVAGVPVQGADACFKEKMQNAEDQDCILEWGDGILWLDE